MAAPRLRPINAGSPSYPVTVSPNVTSTIQLLSLLERDSDTQAFVDFSDPYDSEQGGWPLKLPSDSSSKALAVTMGTNKSSCWFGTRADGTAALWLDQTSSLASVTAPLPALTTAANFSAEGTFCGEISAGSSNQYVVMWNNDLSGLAIGNNLIATWDGTYNSTTISGLGIGIDDWVEFDWRVRYVGTAVTVDVRLTGETTWTNAISATGTATDVGSKSFRVGYFQTASQPCRGQFTYVRVRDGGFDDSIVAEFTPTLFAAGNRSNADTATDAYGVTWTLTKPSAASNDEPKVIEAGARRFVLPGVSGENLSVPDSAANSITGDLALLAKVALSDYTPASTECIASKYSGASQRSWLWQITSAGLLEFGWSTTGSDFLSAASTVAVPDGTEYLAVAIDVDTDVRFYTSSDGVAWSLLGDAVAIASTSIFDSTTAVTVSGFTSGTIRPLTADVGWLELRSGGIGGTLVERIDPADADPDASTFTSATSGATVTINRTTSANYHVEVVEANQGAIQTDGVNDYAVVIGDDLPSLLPVTGAVDARIHHAQNYRTLLANCDSADDGFRTELAIGPRPSTYYDDSAAAIYIGDGVDGFAFGERFVTLGAVSDGDSEQYADGVSTEQLATSLSAYDTGEPWTIGSHPNGGQPLAATFFAVGVIADRVSDTYAAEISTEWAAS